MEMMEKTAAQWAEAAWVCKSLGFQMVNLHGGHGWLLNQFISLGSTTAPTSLAAAWKPGPVPHYGVRQDQGGLRRRFPD